jgi:hypothetical protein
MSFAAPLFLVAIGVLPAYAQEVDNSMIMTTSKGSLDIRLEPIQSNSTEVRYNVSFFNPGTETLHEHQDYDLRILKNGEEIFSAARQTNQALIHNVDGDISVPYNFEEGGEYTVEILILGLGFGPTLIPTEENVSFPIVVTPEFPVQVVGVLAAVVGSTIAVTRKARLF